MRSIFLFAITTALFTIMPMAAAENRDGSVQESLELKAMKDCDANQSNMNLCSYRRYKELDGELNNLYKAQLARLKGTKHATRLIDAEKIWLKYITADCLYQNGTPEESGTIWALAQNSCLSQHLEHRIELLKSFRDCTEGGCPGE